MKKKEIINKRKIKNKINLYQFSSKKKKKKKKRRTIVRRDFFLGKKIMYIYILFLYGILQ